MRRPLLQELEDARHHGAVVGAGAVEPLEALLGQGGGGAGMAAHRDAVAVHQRLDDRGVAARALAVQPVDLVDRDELLGQGAGLIAAALVVAHHQRHLGPAQAGEPFAGAERDGEIRVVVVDDVLHGLAGPEVLLAQAREVAGERQQLADQHLADRGLGPDGRAQRDGDEREDRDGGDQTEHAHAGPPPVSAVRAARDQGGRRPERPGSRLARAESSARPRALSPRNGAAGE